MFTGIKNVFNALFGKVDTSLWERFAETSGGTFKYFGGESYVTIQYKGVEIVLNSHTHYVTVGGGTRETFYTVGKIFYSTRDNYKLQLTREGWIEKLGKLFGLKDVQIGDDEFDRKYLIKSKDDDKTKQLFSHPDIKAGIRQLELIRLEITDEDGLFGELPTKEKWMVYAANHDKAKHRQQLEEWLKLFKALADSMIQSGVVVNAHRSSDN